MKKTLIFLMLAVGTVSIAQESFKLRLNYNKGDVYVASMEMSQDMGLVMSMGMNVDMNIEITEVNGDTYISEMKFEKIKMDMVQGGTTINFDSSVSEDKLDETGKMMKTQMDPMLKAVITAKGNNLGEVLEMKVEPNVPGMSDMGNQATNVAYPKEAIQVGSTWTAKKNEKGMVLDFVYTVKSITKNQVNLEISGKVSGIATGTITGTMEIDKLSGVPMTSLIDMDLKISGQDMESKVMLKMKKK